MLLLQWPNKYALQVLTGTANITVQDRLLLHVEISEIFSRAE